MAVSTREIRIPLDEGVLLGDLSSPGDRGLVLFVHGRGLGRHSSEARTLAHPLHEDGIATLAMDLLSTAEQAPHGRAADAALLTARVMHSVDWLGRTDPYAGLPLGICGVGAGGAVALIAAARLGKAVQAVASVGGRPDVVGAAVLSAIRAPTLLLVGSRDRANLPRHDAAYHHLKGERSLGVIPKARSGLEEPGVLAHAGHMVSDWFQFHLLALEEVA